MARAIRYLGKRHGVRLTKWLVSRSTFYANSKGRVSIWNRSDLGYSPGRRSSNWYVSWLRGGQSCWTIWLVESTGIYSPTSSWARVNENVGIGSSQYCGWTCVSQSWWCSWRTTNNLNMNRTIRTLCYLPIESMGADSWCSLAFVANSESPSSC